MRTKPDGSGSEESYDTDSLTLTQQQHMQPVSEQPEKILIVSKII
jgi:hypothetical protein